jgi:hypothetical protein
MILKEALIQNEEVLEIKKNVPTEPIVVKAYQCPHCKKMMKTKRGIKKHIENCTRNPKFYSFPFEVTIDEKGRVLDKRRRLNWYSDVIVLFVDDKFSQVISIDGQKPDFIKYPRNLDYDWTEL